MIKIIDPTMAKLRSTPKMIPGYRRHLISVSALFKRQGLGWHFSSPVCLFMLNGPNVLLSLSGSMSLLVPHRTPLMSICSLRIAHESPGRTQWRLHPDTLLWLQGSNGFVAGSTIRALWQNWKYPY